MDYNEIFNLLEKERIYAKNNYVPIIRNKSAKYLFDYVKSNNFSNVLEIGTAIGYSGTIILSACNCHLTTIEKNEKLFSMAKNTFSKFCYEDRVDLNLGDAKLVLKYLVEKNKKYDFIFLDGPKGQYFRYLDDLSKLLVDNGVIFADNVLLQGLVESDEYICHKKRAMVVNLRKYMKLINEEPFITEIIRIEDGIAITKIKKEKK